MKNSFLFSFLFYIPLCFAGRLHDAARDGNLDRAKSILHRNIFEKFFKIGPTVHSKTSDGDTPLHIAARSGNIPMAILFLEFGADLSALNKNRSTPLHYAAFAGHQNMVEFLIGRGANIFIYNSYNRSPIDLAKIREHKALAAYLLEEGKRRDPTFAERQARRAIARDAIEEASEIFTEMYRDKGIEHATEECSVCTRNLLYLEQVIEKCLASCQNGHRICGDCRSSIINEICPICRSSY